MDRIVLLSIIGGMNWQLLPHFLRHYQGLGITRYVIAINDEQNAPEYSRILNDWDIAPVGTIDSFFLSDELSHRERLHQHVHPDDWVVYADLDEFILYTKPIDELVNECLKQGSRFVGGLMIDHIAADGSLPAIHPESPSLWEQFPLMCEMTRKIRKGWNSKVILKQAGLPVWSGNHATRIPPTIPRYPEWMEVHHFHWDATLVPRLKHFISSFPDCDYLAQMHRMLSFVGDPPRLDLDALAPFIRPEETLLGNRSRSPVDPFPVPGLLNGPRSADVATALGVPADAPMLKPESRMPEEKEGRSAILVTAGDASYFELLQGTVRSIRDKPQGRQVALAVFDLGFTEEQLQWLQLWVDVIRRPEWDIDFPGKDQCPEHLKSLVVRPFLRKYFPGFNLYLWIDADAWVQDWQAVELFLQGAQRRGLAVVPEIDRSFRFLYGGVMGKRGWYYKCFKAAFGVEIAGRLAMYPMINAGVFGLAQQAPHWQVWAQYLQAGLQRSAPPMTDQVALNLTAYDRSLFPQTELLPAWCNWPCHHALPGWDKSRRCLVEPYLPHAPIGIVHLVDEKKRDRVQLMTTDGEAIEVSLRYSPAVPSNTQENARNY